jgi:hypothetical protein
MVFISVRIRSILIDILALAFIYFIPTLSNLLNLPVYLLDPMRLMLILAIAHTTKFNAYLLALVMPFFSLIISGHPLIFKALPMVFELVLNVWLFFLLIKKIKEPFFSMLISILISKLVYYGLKYLVIVTGLLDMELISTPICIQLVMMVIFSGYIKIVWHHHNKPLRHEA